MKPPDPHEAVRVYLDAHVEAHAKAPRLRIPSWVPRPVADYARLEWEGLHNSSLNGRLLSELSPRAAEDLRRLACDRRMRAVWHELARRHGDRTFMYLATAAGQTADERQDAAMAELFRRIWNCQLKPHATVTRRAAEQNHARLMATVKDLTDIAATLTIRAIKRGEDAATLDERLRLVMGAVGEIEDYAAENLAAEMRAAVERDHGEGRTRWFVLAVAEATTALFGSPFYGLVAIITSVALKRDI